MNSRKPRPHRREGLGEGLQTELENKALPYKILGQGVEYPGFSLPSPSSPVPSMS